MLWIAILAAAAFLIGFSGLFCAVRTKIGVVDFILDEKARAAAYADRQTIQLAERITAAEETQVSLLERIEAVEQAESEHADALRDELTRREREAKAFSDGVSNLLNYDYKAAFGGKGQGNV